MGDLTMGYYEIPLTGIVTIEAEDEDEAWEYVRDYFRAFGLGIAASASSGEPVVLPPITARRVPNGRTTPESEPPRPFPRRFLISNVGPRRREQEGSLRDVTAETIALLQGIARQRQRHPADFGKADYQVWVKPHLSSPLFRRKNNREGVNADIAAIAERLKAEWSAIQGESPSGPNPPLYRDLTYRAGEHSLEIRLWADYETCSTSVSLRFLYPAASAVFAPLTEIVVYLMQNYDMYCQPTRFIRLSAEGFPITPPLITDVSEVRDTLRRSVDFMIEYSDIGAALENPKTEL